MTYGNNGNGSGGSSSRPNNNNKNVIDLTNINSSSSSPVRNVHTPTIDLTLENEIENYNNVNFGDNNNNNNHNQDQDNEQDEFNHIVDFGRLTHIKVVGVRYYRGMTHPGEAISLIREPHNPYDRNAIRVDNMNGIQVGHIPRGPASSLASLIDSGKLRVEGMVTGMKGSFDLPIECNLFGPVEYREQVLEILRLNGLRVVQNAVKEVAGGSSSGGNIIIPELRFNNEDWARLLEDGKSLSAQSRNEMMQKLGVSVADLANMPEGPSEPDALMVKLLNYQRQGVNWMINQEHPALPEIDPVTKKSNIVMFWQRVALRGAQDQVFQNVSTSTMQREAPKLMRGGVLADDMGLGKTLQTIALILADPTGKDYVPRPTPFNPHYSRATLIVCPVSVIGNWMEQINQFVTPGKLSVYVYHGNDRKNNVEVLSGYDIVITSYNMVSISQKGQGKGGLHAVRWRRIVLDEGHIIRTHKTKQSQAACELQGERKWILSGTPIQNTISDLYGLLKFLDFKPYDSLEWFNRMFAYKIRKGIPEGLHRLKALLGYICLRRTKDMLFDNKPIIDLPTMTEYVHKVQFAPAERQVYDQLVSESREQFRQLLQHNEHVSMHNMLEILTRMRQVCCHTGLIANRQARQRWTEEEVAQIAKEANVTLSGELIRKLLKVLNERAEEEECSICLDVMKAPVITRCGHCFCKTCIEEVINANQQHGTCPLCRQEVERGQLMAENELESKLNVIEEAERAERAKQQAENAAVAKAAQKEDDKNDDDDEDEYVPKKGEDSDEEYAPSSSQRKRTRSSRRVATRQSKRSKGKGKAKAVDEEEYVKQEDDDIEELGQGQQQQQQPEQPFESSSKIDALLRIVNSTLQQDPTSKIVIFSQWTSMLKLVERGIRSQPSPINYVLFDGSMTRKAREKAINKFQKQPQISIFLASLKCAAWGLNLTAANTVILCDVWWNFATESQAIDRVYRLGQYRPVSVFRLIMEDSIEEKVLDIQAKKKVLAEAAFLETNVKKKEKTRKGRIDDIRGLIGLDEEGNTQG